MKSPTSLLLAALPILTLAQNEGINYTDKPSGITFNTWPLPDLTFGMALPSTALTTDATEFLGLLTCASKSGLGTGWCGLSLGGGMVNNLLLIAYPSPSNPSQVLTSFRWATAYGPPVAYTGNAKLTQVSSTTNATHFSVIFRCQNCLSWSQGGETGSAPTSAGFLVLGWAHATANPTNGACGDSASVRRHTSEGMFGAVLNSAVANPAYASWAAKATATVTGSCGNPVVTSVTTLSRVPIPSATPARPSVVPSPPKQGCAKTYKVVAGDYCYKIATENGLSLDQLLGINPGLECNPLQIGVVVCVKK